MPTRIIAALELVLIVFPTTILALCGACVFLMVGLTSSGVALGLALAVAFFAMAGVWRLLLALLRGPNRSPTWAAPRWWFAVWAGGAFVICGLLLWLLMCWFLEPSDPSVSILGPIGSVAVFGLPMLIPLVHLAVEKDRDARSNKRLQATRPKPSAPEA